MADPIGEMLATSAEARRGRTRGDRVREVAMYRLRERGDLSRMWMEIAREFPPNRIPPDVVEVINEAMLAVKAGMSMMAEAYEKAAVHLDAIEDDDD